VASGLWRSDVGSGPPVLFIHGGGTHGPLWTDDLKDLSDTHRLIVPTRRGYPGSPPSPRDWSAHADDMAGVLDDCDVPSAAVVAHSAGCIVALDLALRHPERVERLVLLDPGVRLASFKTPAFLWAFGKAQVVRRIRGASRAVGGWFRYALSYRSGGTAWEGFTDARREALRNNAEGVFADFGSGDGSAQIDDERLGGLSLPVTVVIAGQTPETLRRSGEHLAETIPGASRVLIREAGHALAFDQPEELLEVIRAALEPAEGAPAD
jgi:pimeloyl-ACP methyl ester carboxylesterase